MIGRDDTGASAVEYALIANAIAAVVIVAAVFLGGATRDLFSNSCDVIQGGVETTAACPP